MLRLDRIFQFLDPDILLGHLGREISPTQGLYLHTRHQKTTESSHTDIHAVSGIQTHDLSVSASKDSSCLRPRSL
jgi:hypothetical protein